MNISPEPLDPPDHSEAVRQLLASVNSNAARENRRKQVEQEIEDERKALERTMSSLRDDHPGSYDPREDVGMDPTTQAYIDRTMEAVRAGNDARFTEIAAELKGLRTEIGAELKAFRTEIGAEIKGIHSDLSALKTGALGRRELWGAALTTIATVLGVGLAVLAFGGDRFDAGLSAQSLMEQIEQNQAERDAAQDTRFNQIIERLDALAAE